MFSEKKGAQWFSVEIDQKSMNQKLGVYIGMTVIAEFLLFFFTCEYSGTTLPTKKGHSLGS